MKNPGTLIFCSALLIAAGFAYDEHRTAYRTEPAYGGQVISSSPTQPTVYTSTETGQGAAAAAQVMSDSDRVLANQVRQQLNRYPDVATVSAPVQVYARNGVVTLNGYLPSEQDR